MTQALPVRRFSRSVPNPSHSGVKFLPFAMAGIFLLVLAVTLTVRFPLGSNNSGWDDGSYLANFDD